MPLPTLLFSRPASRGLVAAVGVGVVLALSASQIAGLLARLLPWRSEVKSAGTFFPAFPESAPIIIERIGWTLIVAPVLAIAVSALRGLRLVSGRVVGRIAATLLAAATALWIGWLATPHNGFPSNSRIHWVDFQTVRTERYFYAAKRIPHLLFYEMPPVGQALNAAILVALCVLVARQLGFSLPASVLLSSIVATSGNLLLFANTAEDVFINLTLVFIVIAASLHGRAIWLGLALAALLLGRPQFIIIFAAVPIAELLVAARRRALPGKERVIHTVTTLGVAIAGTFVAQIVFSILGDRYFFVNGRVVDAGDVEQSVARQIDGFTIHAFSGTYVTHLLWVIPVVTLLLAATAIVRATRLEQKTETTVYFCALSVVLLLALHEAQPLLYFNIRYLTYLFPFLVVMSWAAVKTVQCDPRFDEGHPTAWVAPLLFVLAVLAPMTIPAGAIESKRRLESRPEIELLDVRDELNDLARDRSVYLDFSATSTQNYVAYILRRGVDTVRLIDADDPPTDGIVISISTAPWDDSPPILSTDRLSVFEVEASSD